MTTAKFVLTQSEWVALLVAAIRRIGMEPIRAAAVQAIGVERATMLFEEHERTRVTKDEVRVFVRAIAPSIPGDTDLEKKAEIADVIRDTFGPVRGLEVLQYAVKRLSAYEADGGTIDALPPEPEPAPAPGSPKVLKGGDGLYKPETNLWLLPEKNPTNGKRFDVGSFGYAGEFEDAAGKIPLLIDGKAKRFSLGSGGDFYHNNRLKMRNAKARRSGVWFHCFDKFGQRIFSKLIQDKDRRQE